MSMKITETQEEMLKFLMQGGINVAKDILFLKNNNFDIEQDDFRNEFTFSRNSIIFRLYGNEWKCYFYRDCDECWLGQGYTLVAALESGIERLTKKNYKGDLIAIKIAKETLDSFRKYMEEESKNGGAK